jgi:hypothetical protein
MCRWLPVLLLLFVAVGLGWVERTDEDVEEALRALKKKLGKL